MTEPEGAITSEIGPWAFVPTWVLGLLAGAELAVYVSLRSFADRRGEARPHVRTIAERAGVSERTAARAITAMRSKGLLTTTRIHGAGGSIVGCNYNLRDLPPGDLCGTTPGATQAPPPLTQVSPPSRRGCQDKGTHQRNTPEKKKTSSSSARAADAARGTRIADDFAPDAEMLSWVREKCPAVPASEHESFIDYWRSVAGAKGLKADWPATWRSWMRRAQSDIDAGRRPGAGRRPETGVRPSTTDQRVNSALNLARQLDAEEQAAAQLAIGDGS